MYADGIQLKILKKDPDINYGSIYENAAAQEDLPDRISKKGRKF